MPSFRRRRKYAYKRRYRTYKRRSFARRRSYRVYRPRAARYGSRTARKVGALYKAVKMRSVYRPSRYVAVKRRTYRRSKSKRSFTSPAINRKARAAKAALKRSGFSEAEASAAVDTAAAVLQQEISTIAMGPQDLSFPIKRGPGVDVLFEGDDDV